MKIIHRSVLFAALSAAVLSGCATAPAYRIENERIVVDSPFALKIGSTEYAKAFGDRIRSSAHARYDPKTKITTTNWYHHSSARLSKPYFGGSELWLSFKGEEKALERCSLDIGRSRPSDDEQMTYEECRSRVKEIAADMEKRLGITMECTSDKTEENVRKQVLADMERYKREGERCGGCASSFLHYSGRGRTGETVVEYSLSGMYSNKGKCSVSVSCAMPWESRFDRTSSVGRIPVYTNEMYSSSVGKLVPTEEQKKAHEEAKKLRETVNRLFCIDLDTPSETNEWSSDLWQTNGQDKVKREWTKLDNPFEGMTERKVNQSIRFLAIPFGTFSLRRPYDGDVTEDELKAQAKRFLDRLEKEYGAKIPEADTTEGTAMLAKMFGEGVPTFGDTKALLGLDKKTYFIGRVGDLAVEIGYAEPRYAKRGEKYEIVCRGAVVVNIVQSPVITKGKAKK